MNEQEQVNHALEILRKYAVQRGDSFDIGREVTEPKEPDVISVLQNPRALAGVLNITVKQAENLRATITGTGAGLASKFLSQYFGEEIAGAFGGLIGGYVSRRILPR